jgi:hypothetical protein
MFVVRMMGLCFKVVFVLTDNGKVERRLARASVRVRRRKQVAMGDHEAVIAEVNRMLAVGLKADASVFGRVIRAATNAGEPVLAMLWVEKCLAEGISPATHVADQVLLA